MVVADLVRDHESDHGDGSLPETASIGWDEAEGGEEFDELEHHSVFPGGPGPRSGEVQKPREPAGAVGQAISRQVILNLTNLDTSVVNWGAYPPLAVIDGVAIMQITYFHPLLQRWIRLVPQVMGDPSAQEIPIRSLLSK
jgi:hypothetical protein